MTCRRRIWDFDKLKNAKLSDFPIGTRIVLCLMFAFAFITELFRKKKFPTEFAGLVLPFNVESKNGRVYTAIDSVADNLMVTMSAIPSATVDIKDIVGVVDRYEIKDDGLYIYGHFINTPTFKICKHFLDAELLTFVPNGVGTVVDGFVKDFRLLSINITNTEYSAFNTKVETK